MRWLGRKLASFLWWTYPRGSLEYDVMVGVILAFIFLTPRSYFGDQPRPDRGPTFVQVRLDTPATKAWTRSPRLPQPPRIVAVPAAHAHRRSLQAGD